MTILNPESNTRRFQRRGMVSLQSPRRDGYIVVLTAVLLTMIVTMIACAIDVGVIMTARTQLQVAVDAGALAGAGELAVDDTTVDDTVEAYIQEHQVAGGVVPGGEIHTELGDWDKVTRSHVPDALTPSAVRVWARRREVPLFFGRVLGRATVDIEAEAVATFVPRDIVVVIDCSSSMNNDSEFGAFSTLGQAAVEANLWQIYNELGAPAYGTMQWDPVHLSGSEAAIRTALGLDGVPYPYPGGSWNDYIDYVQNDDDVDDAGYEDEYGYLTLVGYWLQRRAAHSETPTLWQTSHQPMRAVKDGMAELCRYIENVSPSDRLGLVVYTYYGDGSEAKLESPLTADILSVDSIAQARQAKHYGSGTNIGAGMQKARLELESFARPNAAKIMVLMTDGDANRPDSDPDGFVLQNASDAAAADIKILTISVGAAADVTLMQQVADNTGGIHFNIPGGQSVADYTQQLRDVFRRIALERPLRLVK